MTAIPMARACAGPLISTSVPSRMMCPPGSGWWTPARILTSVLLPAPFSPTSAWISPWWSVSEIESSARVAPKRLETFVNSIAGVPGPAAIAALIPTALGFTSKGQHKAKLNRCQFCSALDKFFWVVVACGRLPRATRPGPRLRTSSSTPRPTLRLRLLTGWPTHGSSTQYVDVQVGHNQDVHRHLGIDVAERGHLVVLEHDAGRNLTADDLAKDAVRI